MGHLIVVAIATLPRWLGLSGFWLTGKHTFICQEPGTLFYRCMHCEWRVFDAHRTTSALWCNACCQLPEDKS